MSTESWVGDMKMLPWEYPRNAHFEKLIDELLAGKHTPESFQTQFFTPMGFSRPLYYLTLATAYFRQFGRQIFVVPQEMGEMLSQTSVSDMYLRDLNFPYPCFYVALKDANLRLWGGPTGWHKMEGLYVSVTEAGVHFYLWGAENKNSTHAGDDAFYWLSLLNNELNHKMSLEALVRSIVMNPDQEEKGNLDLHIFDSLDAPPEVALEQRESILKAVRIVINLILYMDSSAPEIELDPSVPESLRLRKELSDKLSRVKNPNKKSYKHLKKQMDSLHPDHITWIGRNVRSEKKGESSDPSKKAHHWVRGHWWPSKAYLDEKITEAQKSSDYLSARVEEARIRVGESSIENIRRETEIFLALQKGLLQANESLKEAEELIGKKRRWVRPYERYKGEESSQRAYMVAEKA